MAHYEGMTPIYLAGRNRSKDTLKEWRSYLASWGFSVTSRWLEEPADGEHYQLAAQRDWDDVHRAQALLLHNPYQWALEGHGGRHVETGIALAQYKPVVIVGDKTNVFHELPYVHHAYNIQEAATILVAVFAKRVNLSPWNNDR